MNTLKIPPHEETWEIPDGTMLLEAIQTYSLPIPLGCYGGHCTTCTVEVLSGMESLSPIHPVEVYSLTEEELALNYRLACKVKLLQGEVTLCAVHG